MGGKVGDSGGGAGAPLVELNTTPLIDVMLVLLVMLIITIPIQTHAVKVDLPVNNPNPPPIDVKPDINKLAIDTQGAILWNGSPIDLGTLRTYLDRTKGMTPQPELHVQPDAYSRYAIFNEVIAVVKRSGVSKVGFVGNEQYGNFGK